MAQLVVKTVMEAVHFDNQLQPMRDEVGVVAAYGCLSAKVRALYRNAPEMPPERAFFFGHGRAKPSRGLQLEPIKFWHRESRSTPTRRFAATSPIKGR